MFYRLGYLGDSETLDSLWNSPSQFGDPDWGPLGGNCAPRSVRDPELGRPARSVRMARDFGSDSKYPKDG